MSKKIDKKIDIVGKRVLVVGFWGNKNMGDELILAGTLNLLLEQKKQVFVISQNNQFLKNFLSQFLDVSQITFVQELPRGFRSGVKYLFSSLFQLRYFWKIDEVILGGGEILTEESPSSYRYWLWSIRPAFHFKKTNLTIMGGVQIPKKKSNLQWFRKIIKHTKRMYVRDFQALEDMKKFGYQEVDFFMDTSYFSISNWNKYKKKSQKYIIVNVNSNGEKFLGDIIEDIKIYVKKGYTIYYVPVCIGMDNDLKYFNVLKEKLPKEAKIESLDRVENFEKFLHVLGGAEKVIGTRLHLYLISKFIGLKTIVYPYQKKIIRMQEVLSEITV